MDLSVFLAKLLGLYLLIVSFIMLFRKEQVEASCKEVTSSKGMLAISASFSLIFGLVIAIDHSIWEWSWRGLVTLLGYLMIIKGFMRFAYPNRVKKFANKVVEKNYWVVVIIMLIIGIYLTYCGFTNA